MRNWAYIKASCLAKLNMDDYGNQSEGVATSLINRFKTYANEAMSQICSSVKPQLKYLTLNITENLVNTSINIENLKNSSDVLLAPNFISFSYDNSKYSDNGYDIYCDDSLIDYESHNTVICKATGTYKIAYNAKWYDFSGVTDTTVIPAPDDVLDCIPSYIVSQCYKIEDEYKASVFRNEYEMFLARLDVGTFNTTHDIKIEGDW